MSSMCVVCAVEFDSAERHTNKVKVEAKKLFQIFCDYLLLDQSKTVQSQFDLDCEPSPFCTECRLLLYSLFNLDCEVKDLRQKINKVTAQVLHSIVVKSKTTSSLVDEMTFGKVDMVRTLLRRRCSPRVVVEKCDKLIDLKFLMQTSRKRKRKKMSTTLEDDTYSDTGLMAVSDHEYHDDYCSDKDKEDLPVSRNRMKTYSKRTRIQPIKEENDFVEWGPDDDDDPLSYFKDDDDDYKPNCAKDVKETSSKPEKKLDKPRKRPKRDSVRANESLGDGKWIYNGKWPYTELEDGKYNCDTCKKIKSSRSVLMTHLRVHQTQDLKKYYCALCDLNCADKKKLDIHNTSVRHIHNASKFKETNASGTQEATHEETVGDLQADSSNAVPSGENNESLANNNNGESSVSNAETMKISPEKQKLVSRRVTNYAGKITKSLGDGKWLYHGKWNFHEVENGKFQCDTCDTVCKNRGKIVNHLRLHEVKDAKMFYCGFCNVSVIRQTEFDKHIATNRHKKYEAENRVTKYVPISEKVREKHSTEGRYLDEWPWEAVDGGFKCLTCGGFRNSKHNLFTHIQEYHCYREEFVCDVCAKVFVIKKKFMNHLALHSTERPFMCDTCGATMRSGAELADHKRSHKSWKCDICQRIFSGPSGRRSMNNHRRRVHGVKSFICRVEGCGESFAFQRELAQHKYRHETGKIQNQSQNVDNAESSSSRDTNAEQFQQVLNELSL